MDSTDVDTGTTDVIEHAKTLDVEPSPPKLFDIEGRVRLSFSAIDTYAQCPAKFAFAYRDRLPTKPGPHLSFGTSVHSVLERAHDPRATASPTPEQLQSWLYDDWDTTGFQQMQREEQLGWYRRAQRILETYLARNEGTLRPAAATEQWFEMPFDQAALVVGSIDRVDADPDGTLHVIDYKTGKLKNQADVRQSLQLALYALACESLWGRLPATVTLDFVAANVPVTVDVADLDLEAARQAVLDMAAAVRSEQFAPEPQRLCDWCDFKALCPAFEGDAGETVGELRMARQQLARSVRKQLRELEDLDASLGRLDNQDSITDGLHLPTDA